MYPQLRFDQLSPSSNRIAANFGEVDALKSDSDNTFIDLYLLT
jgi:hypothetical protein